MALVNLHIVIEQSDDKELDIYQYQTFWVLDLEFCIFL
jgi:hypothetical protein